jgi:pyruvate/2-oxoglutarate dehydrogenase complex dihydrolipoamide acyltransferase (E2) component
MEGDLKSVSYSKFATGRKTVVDLLTMVAPRSVSAYLFRDIDMSWVGDVRSDFAKNGSRVTVTAMLLKAIAIAQKSHPTSRSELLPFGRIATYEEVVGGFTVERSEDGADTVFFAEIEEPDTKQLLHIAEELSRSATSDMDQLPPFAKQKIYAQLPYFLRRLILGIGTLIPALRLKCQKATFGLTSLGKYKMSMVLSPCICTSTFGIGTIEDRPVVVDGNIVVRPVMTISLNFNANALEISAAAAFLEDVCSLMEGSLADEASMVQMSYSQVS